MTKDTAYQCARARRNFRTKVIPGMPDKELLEEADYLAGWIRMITQGVPTVYRVAELQARLRMLHNEAGDRNIGISWDRTTGVRL